MAIIKHIKSRNANYSDALNYLLINMMKKVENKSLMNMAINFFEKNFIWTD